MTWWRTSKGRTQALIGAFGLVALGGMLVAGSSYFARGDTRQLVVTLQQGVGQADRVQLKQDCGGLAGVTLVPDQGAADKQYRFPVRFSLRGATAQQETALTACVDRHRTIVRGYNTEGDAN